MRGPRVQPVAIAAGGTGGHFFPAEALAAELVARGRRIALLTDARASARVSGTFSGHEHHVIAGAGVAGRGVVRSVGALAAMAAGVAQARGLLSRAEPCAIVGFGGYPSVAPVLASATLRHRPAILLHEQNAVLGRANRMLCRWADVLALSVSETTRVPPGVRTEITGNPVRSALAGLAAAPYAPPREEAELLVLGGSLGARVLSDVVPKAVALLGSGLRARLRVVQQCRPEDLDRVGVSYAAIGVRAELATFFDDIADRLGAAHLVIARAGASTVAELALAGRPSVLVPLPGAIDDHQHMNARALTRAGAAWSIAQPEFKPDTLAAILSALLQAPSALAAASAAARAQARQGAARDLADLVEMVATAGARP